MTRLITASMLATTLFATAAAAQFNFGPHALRLDVGSPGEWNDQDVLNPIVLETAVFSGYPKTMYYCGHGGPYGNGPERHIIGVARSVDGVTWHRHPTAMLGQGPSGAWDDSGRIHISVVEDPVPGPMRFRMYYSASDGPDGSPSTKTQIGLAVSSDGLSFSRFSPLPILPVGSPGSWDDAAVFACCVLAPHQTGLPGWRMWYTGFSDRPGVPGATAGIGFASSPDGLTWTKAPLPIAALSGGDLSGGYFYQPSVTFAEGKFRMWVTRQESLGAASPIRSVHYLTSPDGHLTWDWIYQPHGSLRYCYEAFPQWDSATSEVRLWFVEQGGGGTHPFYGGSYDNIRVATAPIYRDHPDEPYLLTATAWYGVGPLTIAVSEPRAPGALTMVFADLTFNAAPVSVPTPFGILALQSALHVGTVTLDPTSGVAQLLMAGHGRPGLAGLAINFQAAVLAPALVGDQLTNPMTVRVVP